MNAAHQEKPTFSPAEVRRYYSIRVPSLNLKDRSEWRGACPVHRGTRDSFAVRAESGLWRCHSECDRGGDIIELEMLLTGAPFKEALASVRDLVGQPAANRKMNIVAEYDYVDESGQFVFQVVRLEPKDFRQRQRGPNGKWIWNLQGVRRVLFRLPRVIASSVVFIAEGEKDVLAIERILPEGMAATTNSAGAGKWDRDYSEILRGKRVIIVPDQDQPGLKHALAVYAGIKDVAAAVGFLNVPKPHKDFADWAAAEEVTLEAMRALTTDTPPATPMDPPKEDGGEKEHSEQSGPSVVVEMPRRQDRAEKLYPNELAELILRDHHWIVNSADFMWKYDGRRWAPDSDTRIRTLAMEYDGLKFTTSERRNEIVKYIRARSFREHVNWRKLKQYEVPVINGVVDVRTGEIRDHHPDDTLQATAAVAYDKDADCPRWRKAMQQYFGDDRAGRYKVLALAQFFGYALMQHARYKKALVLFGKGDTGKSAVGEMLCELVGRNNVCSIQLKHMGDDRKLYPLVGKSLNYLPDVSSQAVIEDGGFKQLVSTEDQVQIDPKWAHPFSYVPIAKHVLLMNSLPNVTDRTMATYNRLLIVKFERVLPKAEQDRTIWDQFKAELPGILNWAIEGARSLYEANGEFVILPDLDHQISEYRQDQMPIFEFIAERCERDADSSIRSSEFRRRYVEWYGRSSNMTPMKVTADIRAAELEIERDRSGAWVRGVKWRE